MTEERPEQHESDQLRQRRANFEELQRLGVVAYPHAFERTDTVEAVASANGDKSSKPNASKRARPAGFWPSAALVKPTSW
jgi:lysyl-tRNA synthetase class II